MVLAEDETDKTRVLEYGTDDFTTKPISAETIVGAGVLLQRYYGSNG
jgi:DNA-binding response OmpR family regulator